MEATEDPLLDLVPVGGRKSMMWADYLVFGVLLVVYIVIGLVQAFAVKKQPDTAAQFMSARGEMPVFPVVFSLMSSVLSAVIILGGAAEVYTQGAMYWLQGIGQWGATIVAACLFIPLLYPMNLGSSYEYLEMRFKSRTVKLCGTLYLIVGQMFYMGVCIYSPATALEAVTGFPEEGSIVIGAVVAGLYCCLGGMKANIYVGAVQTFVMLFGTLVGIIKPCMEHPGGIKALWKTSQDTGRLDVWDFDPSPLRRHTFFTLIFGNAVNWTAGFGVSQGAVQRYCSVGSKVKAYLVVLLNGPGMMVFTLLCALSGGTIFGWYHYVGCDPLEAGYVSNANQMLPFYILDRMGYPCVGGLFMAAIFAGALSSMSGSIAACATCFWNDFFEWKFHYIPERKKNIINRCFMVFFTGIGIGIAFLVKTFGGTVLQLSLSLTGACSGPMLGLFLLGGLFPCAEYIGATISSLLAFAFALWLVLGTYNAGISMPKLNTTVVNCINYTAPLLNDTEPLKYPHNTVGIDRLYSISYLYYSALGCGITIFLGLFIGFFVGCDKASNVKPYLHIPLGDRLFCCVRNKTLDALRYGYSKKDILLPEDMYGDKDEKSLSSHSSSSSSSSTRKHEKDGIGYENKGYEPGYDGQQLRQRTGDQDGGLVPTIVDALPADTLTSTSF